MAVRTVLSKGTFNKYRELRAKGFNMDLIATVIRKENADNSKNKAGASPVTIKHLLTFCYMADESTEKNFKERIYNSICPDFAQTEKIKVVQQNIERWRYQGVFPMGEWIEIGQ